MSKNFILFTCLSCLAIGGIALVSKTKNSANIPSVVHERESKTKSDRIITKRKIPQIVSICNPELHWEERLKAVRELPDNLSKDSTDQLFEFLRKRPVGDSSSHWYIVSNEIMEECCKRSLITKEYSILHLDLLQTKEIDPVIRDYAAQHLAIWISGLSPDSEEKDPAMVEKAFKAMCAEALKIENGNLTLTGTILNSLADGVAKGNAVMKANRKDLEDTTMRILDSAPDSVSDVNRSTALQVAARLQMSGVAERCRTLAVDSTVAPDLRLSAVAALGLVGTAHDRPFLESFADNSVLKFAASAAIERVEKRQ